MNAFFALTLSPLLLGIVNKTKAFFAGRQGPPLLQVYWDVWKLLRKGATYSRTTTWVFRAGPMVGLGAIVLAALVVPLGGAPGLLAFPGDVVLVAYLLGLARFATMAAALDTGSAFEGMGASREAQFGALAEPSLFLAVAALTRATGHFSLSGIYDNVNGALWAAHGPALGLVAVAILVVTLAENSRVPVDDPNTHLELTMIHEVMVLDHGGPDFAFILYGAAIKLWLLGSLLVGVVFPLRVGWFGDGLLSLVAMGLLGVTIGAIESSMARLRLYRVPQFLVGAGAMSALAFVLVMK